MKLLGQPRGQVTVDARALLGGEVADLARDGERAVLGELAPLQRGQREGRWSRSRRESRTRCSPAYGLDSVASVTSAPIDIARGGVREGGCDDGLGRCRRGLDPFECFELVEMIDRQGAWGQVREEVGESMELAGREGSTRPAHHPPMQSNACSILPRRRAAIKSAIPSLDDPSPSAKLLPCAFTSAPTMPAST